MKAIILLSVSCLCLLFGCEKESNNSIDTSTDNFIRDNYLADVTTLYAREISSDPSHPNYNEALLDTVEINKILSYFQAVYELNTMESDAVFNQFKIHALKHLSVHSIVLIVDPSATELFKLVSGSFPTGNNALDEIMINYKFEPVLSNSYPIIPWITIKTKESYNLIPIINTLRTIPFILNAVNNGTFMDGDDIIMTKEGEKTFLDFSIGRGDCPAGCGNRYHMIFSIENMIAKFEGYE